MSSGLARFLVCPGIALAQLISILARRKGQIIEANAMDLRVFRGFDGGEYEARTGEVAKTANAGSLRGKF